jgi:mediator of RNA polymerase II transcription subunit 17
MAVDLSVEPFTDRLVKEFTVPTGEVFAEKQTLSQKWGELVQQIDFSKTADELKAIVAAKQNADAAEEDANSEKALWPWEDVSQRLRKALTEMSVLSDVLKVVQHQNYLSLAPVVQECPKPPVAVKLKAKQKALACAASVLLTGAEALSTRIETVEIQSSSVADPFVSELVCLRKLWKVKRIGQTITGSLGYQFGDLQRQVSTQFEVRRVEDTQTSAVSSDDTSQLQVIIPRDLQVQCHLHLYVSQNTEVQRMGDRRVVCLPNCGYKPLLSSPVWHQQLQQAQNLLANKLAYLLLTHDAFARNPDIQSLTNGNIMHTQLFPDTWLTIACIEKPDPDIAEQKAAVQSLDPVPCLELILFQQLCRLQKQCRGTPPCPISVSSYLMDARKTMDGAGKGPSSSQQVKPSDSLLTHLITVTRHLTLYGRVCRIVEELSDRIREPVLTVHCGHMCSSMQSVIVINIASAVQHQELVGKLLADTA